MTETITKANGIELCYETFGDPGGEPMLLVMGLGAQLIAWPVEFCEAFVDRGFFVIRYDNRDVGRSTTFDDLGGEFLPTFLAASQGQPVDVAYRLTDLAADGMALLDVLGIDSAHIVGASMGGMIAQTMAIEHPNRVRTLTSIMSSTGEPDVGQPTPLAMERLLQPPPTTREEAIASGLEARRLLGSPEAFDEVGMTAVIAESYDRNWNPAGTARQLLAIVASGSRAEGLAQVQAPTLVIHGDADPLVTPSGGIRTAELIPGAELLLLPGMGHDLPPAYVGPIVEAITSLVAGAQPA